MQEPVETGEKQEIKRDALGRFPKGVSGNPNGAPKGQRKTALLEIEEAIEEFRETHGVSYWKAATMIAMKQAKEDGNTTLLGKILDKFVPSKVVGEGFQQAIVNIIRAESNVQRTTD